MCLVNFKFKVVLIFLCLDDSRPHTIPTPSGPTPLQCICQSLGLQVRRGIPRYSSNELPDKITMNSYTIFLFSLLSICLSVALYVYLFLSFSEVTQKPIFCVTAEKTETSQEFDWQLSLSLSPPSLYFTYRHTHTRTTHSPVLPPEVNKCICILHGHRLLSHRYLGRVKNQPFMKKRRSFWGLHFEKDRSTVCLFTEYSLCINYFVGKYVEVFSS